MREIKFRYRYEQSFKGETGIVTRFYNLDDIAELAHPHKNERVLSRDEFTGLKDKNAKEGYHKDITEGNGRKYLIEWLDKRAQFVLIPNGASAALALPMECLSNMEIIGNIYEDTELLEAK